MSKFLGITFADQNVQPSDDAAVRRAALSDGFLYGCELSYAGSTLTMASGQIIACGRQFEHPTSDNWAVVDATSGYARLLLTIDLSRTSTEDNFDQITDVIEYATSADGFPELEQEDINTSGLRYQIVVCVISLGTGGITGIVEQIGRSYTLPPAALLWENASPSSDFAATTSPISMGSLVANYNRFTVELVNENSIVIRKNATCYVPRIDMAESGDKGYVNWYYRSFRITNDGLTVGTCYHMQGVTTSGITKGRMTSVAYLKPYRVWGNGGVD